LLLSTDPDKTQQEYIELTRSSAETLLDLINDILDLSKIESGKMEIKEYDFDLIKLLKSIKKIYELQASKKALKLELEFEDSGIPVNIIGDSLRLRQILINLIGNAIKFTEKGEIRIIINKILKDGKPFLKISVKDTGIGISGKDKDKLFKVFSQIDTKAARKAGGTGLGLSISKKLVELLGGDIGFESNFNSGSIFYFTYPLKESNVQIEPDTDILIENKNKDTEQKSGGNKMKILVAEDNYPNQKIIEALLKRKGYEVEIVSNGKEVIEILNKSEFDLILMDLMMPEMDGIEATRLIREKEKIKGGHVLIVALTANAFKEDQEKCLEAGMDDYIAKPINSKELYEMIEKKNRSISGNLAGEKDQNLDLSEFKRLDQNVQVDIINYYLLDLNKQLDNLKENITKNDAVQVRFFAHKIKGGVSNFKASKIIDIAFEIEKKAKDGNLDGCDKLFLELETGIAIFIEILKKYLAGLTKQ
jgi:CheY-like chemotaxis protein